MMEGILGDRVGINGVTPGGGIVHVCATSGTSEAVVLGTDLVDKGIGTL